jgi:ubiquinone/menaquinone biosynthesis C-methylase UbiE
MPTCLSGALGAIVSLGTSVRRERQLGETAVNIRELEEEEIRRSAFQASRSQVEIVPFGDDVFRRYLAPGAGTCYPLEYSYHLLGDVRGKQVLDLGCGSGENSLVLARLGAKVYAMDISEHLLNLAKRRLVVNGNPGDVNLIEASVYDIPLPDESIDVVFGMAILHHLELPLAAREVKRVLREGGRAIFREPVRNSKFIRFARSLIPYRSPDTSSFERPLTDQELAQFADGFSSYNCKAFSLLPATLTRILAVAPRHKNSLYRFDSVLLKRFPSLAYHASVRVIEMVK